MASQGHSEQHIEPWTTWPSFDRWHFQVNFHCWIQIPITLKIFFPVDSIINRSAKFRVMLWCPYIISSQRSKNVKGKNLFSTSIAFRFCVNFKRIHGHPFRDQFSDTNMNFIMSRTEAEIILIRCAKCPGTRLISLLLFVWVAST